MSTAASNPSPKSEKSATLAKPLSGPTWLEELEWSDAEEDSAVAPMDFEAARAVELGFGKHQGTSIGAMLLCRKTRSYLRWCIEKFEGLFDEQKLAIEICLAEFDTAKQARPPVAKKRKRN